MSALISYFENLAVNILKSCKENNSLELNILLNELTESSYIPDSINHLIGPITKLLPCQNCKVKKTVYSILPRVCSYQADAALLVANRVIQDTKDPNPTVKCFAITAFTLIPKLYDDYGLEVLNEGLKDGNPFVRLSTVIGCGNVFKHNCQFIKEQGLVDRLYGCIRDSDPKIVVACLLALDSVLAVEGGIVVNRSIAWYLLKRLADFENSQLATVFQVLQKYQPTEEEELFKELSLLDPYLVHTTSAAVIVNCVQLFLKLTKSNYPHLILEVVKCAVPVLKGYLIQKSSKESLKYIYDFLLRASDASNEWFKAFSKDSSLFYPCKNDDIMTVIKQFKIISTLCNESNFSSVVSDLDKLFCRHAVYSEHAIKCLSIISKKVQSSQSDCVRVLICLLDSDNAQVTHNVFKTLKDFNFADMTNVDKEIIFDKLLSKINFFNKNEMTHVLPVLLRDFGCIINKSPLILENLSEFFLEYDVELRCIILTSVVKLFLHNPSKHQHILGELLKKSIIGGHFYSVHSLEKEKALKYYCIMKLDLNLAKNILLEGIS